MGPKRDKKEAALEGEIELVAARERARVKPPGAKVPGEFHGKAMDREDPLWSHPVDKVTQLVEAGMVGEGKGRVRAALVLCARVERPSGGGRRP